MRTDEVTMRIDMHGTPAENLQRLITDCGVSPHKVQELIQELPPKPFADRLIDWFFSNLNLVRYPIDERLFRICEWRHLRSVIAAYKWPGPLSSMASEAICSAADAAAASWPAEDCQKIASGS